MLQQDGVRCIILIYSHVGENVSNSTVQWYIARWCESYHPEVPIRAGPGLLLVDTRQLQAHAFTAECNVGVQCTDCIELQCFTLHCIEFQYIAVLQCSAFSRQHYIILSQNAPKSFVALHGDACSV